MVDVVYLDEQEADLNGRRFTAICAAIVQPKNMNELRKEFFPWLNSLINSNGGHDDNSLFINRMPIIHGRQLLPTIDDTTKIEVVRYLLECFRKAGGKIIRVGYFDSTLEPLNIKDRNARVSFDVSNLALMFRNWQNQFQFVHEFDREGIRSGLRTIDQEIGGFYCIGTENVSINVQNFVGHFFALKHELGCQIADIAAYLSLKHATAQTEFSRKLAEIYQDYSDIYQFDEIIELEFEKGTSANSSNSSRPY